MIQPPRHYGGGRPNTAPDTPYVEGMYSKPCDPVRQGRVVRDDDTALLRFEDKEGSCLALLGVMIVGQITVDPVGEYFWHCFLPMTPRQQRAKSLEKAQGALTFKVREWCEAAGVVVSAAALRKLRGGS